MTVLVTRPRIDGEALCSLLEKQGIRAINHPLISFEQGTDYAQLPTQLNQTDIVIMVSQQAVKWAVKRLSLPPTPASGALFTSPKRPEKTRSVNPTIFPEHVTFFAIGSKTALILQPYINSKVIVPSIHDSEHLLTLPELQSVENKRILILRGNGGRELIYTTLKKRSAHVLYNDIYQRNYLSLDEHTVQKWQKSSITQLVVTSEEQLTHLITQIPPFYLPWLKKLVLYVPSNRIRLKAKQFGFCHTINTESAANTALQHYITKSTLTGLHHDG